jgi:hypothetical protein
MNFFKKNWIAISTAVSGALAFASCAGATGTYITLPETATADLLDYAGALFTDLWVVIALVIGIPLAFYVIRKVVGLVRAR